MSAGEMGEAVSRSYGVVFDNQTIRLKLKEYEELGSFLERIQACLLSKRPVPADLECRRFHSVQKSADPVVIQISGERNSLEGCKISVFRKYFCLPFDPGIIPVICHVLQRSLYLSVNPPARSQS